jgi:tetratricopeptide (TPR) repeat protein
MFEEANPQEQMLEQAKEAVRRGDHKTARDLLTRLLKDDQNNATYWLWMSAAVESTKERIYCLETALKIDPENAAAKLGLVMHGARPPDDSIPPFPLNRPRPWEDKVVVAGEEDRPRGFKALMANPLARLAGIFLIAIILLGITFIALGRAQQLIPAPTRTPGPPPTYTATVTLQPTPSPYIRTATATFVGPTPLAAMLEATYTPTPLYIDTPHPLSEAFRAGVRYFEAGDYSNASQMMDQVLFIEPNAGDAYYYKGLSALMQDDFANAADTFQQGIKVDPNFAPNYVGYASARLSLNPHASVLDDLKKAEQLDPNFLDGYLQQSRYYLLNDDPASAQKAAQAAIALTPESPLAYLYLAEADLAIGDNAGALEAAITANSLDSTLLEVYRVLGLAYSATDQPARAVGPLQTYTLYRGSDPQAFLLLGDAYHAAQDDQNAVKAYTQALNLDNKLGPVYAKRAIAYLALGDGDNALNDLNTAKLYLPTSLETNLLTAQALLLKGEPNNAYATLLKAEKLVQSDSERAEYLYWRALSLEGLKQLKPAANDWQALLALPEEAVTPDIRQEAEQHLAQILTPTAKPSATP